jgi:hypothetical protein
MLRLDDTTIQWCVTLLSPIVVFFITTYLARFVLDREDSKHNQKLEEKVRKRFKRVVKRRTEVLKSVYEDSSEDSLSEDDEAPAYKHEEQELPGKRLIGPFCLPLSPSPCY